MEKRKKEREVLNSESSIAEMFIKEEIDDKKNYKIAILIAVVAHILLLTTVFPNVGAQEVEINTKNEPVRRKYYPIPPETKLDALDLKKKKNKVPVPDINSEDVEPLVKVETDLEDVETPPDDIIVFPGEIETPNREIVIKAGTYGLVNPVYSVSQLQSSAVYPELGIKTRMEGYVILEVVLKKDGTVGEVKVIGGLQTLGFPRSAMNAAKKLKFTPGKFHGNPVDVVMVLTVNYRLKRI